MTFNLEGAISMTQASRPPWLGIELRHLAALSAIAREGSFRAAADRLGYVQSAVSQQIAHLEEVLGTRLVDRQRGIAPVSLTDAGELLLHHFDDILARIGAAQADLDALRSGRAGQLRVGVCEWGACHLMPHILVEFGRRLPAIVVHLEEARASDLATAVEAGRLDLALGDLPLPPGPFAARELLRDPYVLLLPREWPFTADGNTPSVADIARMPLIGHAGSGAAERLEVELRERGVEPQFTLRSGSSTTVQSLVAAGLGAAIVPRLTVDEHDGRTVAAHLGELLPPRVLMLYWHRERRQSPAFESFREAAALTCRTWHHISNGVGSVDQP